MGRESKHHDGSQFDNLAKCFQQHGIASSQEEDDEKIGGEQVHSLLGYVLHYSVAKLLMPVCRGASRGKHKCVLDAKEGRMGEASHLEIRTSIAMACKGSVVRAHQLLKDVVAHKALLTAPTQAQASDAFLALDVKAPFGSAQADSDKALTVEKAKGVLTVVMNPSKASKLVACCPAKG